MVSDLTSSVQESQPDSHTILVQVMPELAKRWFCCQEDCASLQYAHLKAHCLIAGVPKLVCPLEDLNPGQKEGPCIQQKPQNLPQNLPWSLGRTCLMLQEQMANPQDTQKPFPEVGRSSSAAKHTHLSRIHTPTQTTACHLCTCTETD